MPIPRLDDPTSEPQTLAEILDWRASVAQALLDQRASLVASIRRGEPIASPFFGMTESELNSRYHMLRREIDRLATLSLVASAEATIRLDFYRRIKDRSRDPLSLAYRDWFATLSPRKQLRPDFDEGGILDIVKATRVVDNHLVGRFRECPRARNWIGHGRFWAKPAEIDRLDPIDVHVRADTLINALLQ
jgi:hypothetical protein